MWKSSNTNAGDLEESQTDMRENSEICKRLMCPWNTDSDLLKERMKPSNTHSLSVKSIEQACRFGVELKNRKPNFDVTSLSTSTSGDVLKPCSALGKTRPDPTERPSLRFSGKRTSTVPYLHRRVYNRVKPPYCPEAMFSRFSDDSPEYKHPGART